MDMSTLGDGTLIKPTKLDGNDNIFTPSLHLVPFYQLYLDVFVICVHREIVEGVPGFGSAA